MTGSDHYAQILSLAHDTIDGLGKAPDWAKASGLANCIAAATLGRAAMLLEQHHYGPANDLILLASADVRALHLCSLNHDEALTIVSEIVQRAAEAKQSAVPHPTALTHSDLIELGIEDDRQCIDPYEVPTP